MLQPLPVKVGLAGTFVFELLQVERLAPSDGLLWPGHRPNQPLVLSLRFQFHEITNEVRGKKRHSAPLT